MAPAVLLPVLAPDSAPVPAPAPASPPPPSIGCFSLPCRFRFFPATAVSPGYFERDPLLRDRLFAFFFFASLAAALELLCGSVVLPFAACSVWLSLGDAAEHGAAFRVPGSFFLEALAVFPGEPRPLLRFNPFPFTPLVDLPPRAPLISACDLLGPKT